MKDQDRQLVLDAVIRQQDSIKTLCQTVDKLSDKLMAKDLREYKSLNEPQAPSAAKRMKEDPSIDMMDADGTEILNALNRPNTDGPE